MKNLILLFLPVLLLFVSCEQEEIHAPDNPHRFEKQVFDSIKITKDITYKTAQTISGNSSVLSFDFFEPEGDTSQLRPLVILVHGGGFFQGQKSWMDYAAMLLPKYGYNCASISYRLYDKDSLPINNQDLIHSIFLAREDLISAINFFVKKTHGEDLYKTDVDNIFVMGASAGAITAFHTVPLDLSTLENHDLKRVLDSPDWNYDHLNIPNPDTPIRGIVAFAGAISDPSWISDNFPPSLCVHGLKDEIVPPSEGNISIYNMISPFRAYGSSYICNKLDESGIDNVMILDPDSEHNNFFLKSYLWEAQTIDFLKSQIFIP